MSVSLTTHLTLPQWDCGPRKIRFLYLVNLTSFRLSKCPNQDPAIPLFLGADLLANTDIRTDNHSRYHAKFAKKGLSTKIKFASVFRFHGLKVPVASNCLWFYSIQGLFRVAFEMYGKQEQLGVLDNLQEIWKSQINDSPLKVNYNLTVQLDYLMSTKVSNSTVPQSCETVMELMDECHGDSSADHDYCSFPEQTSQTVDKQPIVSTLKQKLQILDEQLSSQSDRCAEELETLLLLLENIDRYMKGSLEEKDTAETVLALLMAKDWGKDSVYSSYLLTCLGRWLGQQFHSALSTISQKVECFKFQNIETISDLPPAEELASELFPEAMQTLLLHWMGLCDESATGRRRTEFPILLLILEFANHNLITGVAHVLYSALICK